MHVKNYLWVAFALVAIAPLQSQNLLDPLLANWTPGNGDINGFSRIGPLANNNRAQGAGPFGDALLWVGKGNPNNHNNGGFVTDPLPIDASKTYRITVWMKRSGSLEGNTYFGPGHWGDDPRIMGHNGQPNLNPYFFSKDLPALDQWYLMVAYIHDHTQNPAQYTGGIYHGETGERITWLFDYAFAPDATELRLRCFMLFNDRPADRQYFYAPRIEVVNGSEPTIAELLNPKGPKPTKLVFAHDGAGNQQLRKMPDTNQGTALKAKLPPKALTALGEGEDPSEDPEAAFLAALAVYPNPTKGQLIMDWGEASSQVRQVTVSDIAGRSIPIELPNGSTEAQVDLSPYPPGTYLVDFVLEDGRRLQQKILKK